MSARAPRQIKVLGQRITVDATNAHVTAILDGHEDMGDQNLLGYSDIDAGEIMISKHQGADRMRETYLHEAVHVIFSLMGIKRYLERPGRADHEEVVTLLSVGLLATLRDNPALVAYLTDTSRPEGAES